MEATNKAGKIVPLQYIKATEAISILGIYLAPDDNNKYQVKYMNKKSTNGMGNFNNIRGCSKEQSTERLELDNLPNHEIPLTCHSTKLGMM